MSCLAFRLPKAVRCSRVEQEGRFHVNMEATDPSGWSVSEWISVSGILSALALWLWHKPIKKMRNMWSAPDKIANIDAKLDTIISSLSLVMSMTQNTWKVMDRPLWQADAQGKTIHTNKFMLKILYRQESEMLGNGWINSVHEDDRDRVSDAWESAIEDKTNFFLHYKMVNASGEAIPVIGEAFKLTNPSGDVLGYMGCLTLIDA